MPTSERQQEQGSQGNISFDDVVRAERGPGAARPIGLAFSGGGIRSATFNLGLIQGLARARLLDKFDYLSTVSGGGYIGSWLAAWAQRAGGIGQVQQALLDDRPGAPTEPAPVAWLRRYSNYLTPRKGLLSLDTLTGVTYHVRNVFLSTLTIGLFVFGVASLFAALVSWFAVGDMPAWLAALGVEAGDGRRGLSVLGLALGAAGVLWLWYCLPLVSGEKRAPGAPVQQVVVGHRQVVGIALLSVLAVFCWSLAGGYFYTTQVQPEFHFYRHEGAAFAVGYFGLAVGGMLLAKWRIARAVAHAGEERASRVDLGELMLPSAVTAVAFGLYGGLAPNLAIVHFAAATWDNSWLSAGIVAPISCLVVSLLVSVHLGMAGRALASEAYFWASRVGGLMVQLALALCALPVAFLFIPPLFDWLEATLYVGGLGAIYLLVARALGSGTQTGKAGGAQGWRAAAAEVVVQAAPYVLGVVLLGLMVTAAREVAVRDELHLGEFFVSQLQSCKERTVLSGSQPVTVGSGGAAVGSPEQRVECVPSYQAEFAANVLKLASLDSLRALCAGLAALLASLLLSARIDANLFSLHMYYRNRLTNAYLAASTGKDHRNPDTGVNPEDSPFLQELDYGRPYLLLNTTLNLCGGDNDLAWQDRKAMSFVFGRQYCGFDRMAEQGSNRAHYLRTEDFATRTGEAIKLNLPMTISGAAASPLMGYHTSPGVSIMLALLGARLGWWFYNPAHPELWARRTQQPRLLPTFYKEMFDEADASQGRVYLSDGGHFENLGVYELVKRGCAVIVASDAGADPEFTFEDLANAIHKARVDFGVEIEIDPGEIRPLGPKGDAPVRFSAKNFAVGRIRYSASPLARFKGLADGTLIYIKSSLPERIEREARDVWFYAAAHSSFPHEPTSDQWFDEAQFEAYRKLGSLVGLEAAQQIEAAIAAAARTAAGREDR